ncbi:hypothetical protein [Kribbella endophytica]
MRRKEDPATSLEDALRWLATHSEDRPLHLLRYAIESPASEAGHALKLLVDPTAAIKAATSLNRAEAVWGLIVSEAQQVGPSANAKERNALSAAFRLPRRAEIHEPWEATLGARFGQLKNLREVFAHQGSLTPMTRAWTRGLKLLVPRVSSGLATLADGSDEWLSYVELTRTIEDEVLRREDPNLDPNDLGVGLKAPTEGAQPVFLELFVTTIFMKQRAAYRRITERLITSQADNLDGYTAAALVGWTGDQATIPVKALWGCRAERIAAPPGEPAMTKLAFPRPLMRDERHFFSSEAFEADLHEERRWINVEIDHHGIAPGRLLHGEIPVSGLTIRVRFDPDFLPAACWWYAEQTERQRRVRPPEGDSRLLAIIDGSVQHTFTQRCHPRENYGVSIAWFDDSAP